MKKTIFTTFAILILLLTINNALAIDVTNMNTGVVIDLSLDNVSLVGGEPQDLTPNNNDATKHETPTSGVTGIYLDAFDFTGGLHVGTDGDHLRVPTDSTLSPTNELSWSLWINIDTPTDYDNIFNRLGSVSNSGSWSQDDYGYGLRMNTAVSKKLDAGIVLSGGTGDDVRVTTTSTLGIGNWHHIAFTYNGTILKIYINGTLDNTQAGTGTIDYNQAGNMYIGGTNSDAYWFNGQIDEFMIFNYSLSQEEISFLNASGSPDGDQQYTFSSGNATTNTSNFSISAQGTDGEGALSTFNATIVNNGTYTTSGTTIITQILGNDTNTWNITVCKTGYTCTTYNDWNVSINLTANLTALPLENFTLITPNNNITRLPTYTINWTTANSPANFIVTYNVTISYTNGTKVFNINTTNTSYVWNETLETIGNYTINVNATEQYSGDTFIQESSLIILPNQDYFKIYAYDYLGVALLTNINTSETTANVTTTNNPFTQNIYSYLNISNYQHNNTANATIKDLTYKHQDNTSEYYIDRWNTSYNINLEPNKLSFTFYQNYALHITEGVIHHTSLINGTYAFENSTKVLVQQDLALGYVKAKFGMINGTNWTQYYEYINDYQTHVEENIEILQNADWTAYLRVLDTSNNPLKDVTIRASYSYTEIGNWTDFLLLGQRLTQDNGYTFFWGDSGTEVLFTITKDGYEPTQALISIGDDSYTKDEALQFNLIKSDSGVLNNAWIYINRYFDNRSLDLHGTITAIGRDRVQIQTKYRDDLTLPYLDITGDCDALERCPFMLTSGTDFALAGGGDITLYIKLNNVLWRTLTLNYDTKNKNRIFSFTGLNSKYLNPLLIILILMITLIMGLSFKNTNIGIGTFFGTSLLAGMISSSFLWLTVIITIYYTFKIIKKVISE